MLYNWYYILQILQLMHYILSFQDEIIKWSNHDKNISFAFGHASYACHMNIYKFVLYNISGVWLTRYLDWNLNQFKLVIILLNLEQPTQVCLFVGLCQFSGLTGPDCTCCEHTVLIGAMFQYVVVCRKLYLCGGILSHFLFVSYYAGYSFLSAAFLIFLY